MSNHSTELATEQQALLHKTLRRFDIVFLLIAAVVGLETLGQVSGYGAEAFTWALVLAVFFLVPYGLIFAETGAAFSEEGGAYTWVRDAFGRPAAAVASILTWITQPVWVGGSMAFLAAETVSSYLTPIEHGSLADYAFKVVFIWITVLAAVAHLVRAVYGGARPGPGPDAAVAAVAVFIGLCFTERALLILPAAALVLIAMALAGWRATRRGAWIRAIVPSLIVTGIGMIVYFAATSGEDGTPSDPSLAGLGEALKSTYIEVVLSALAGGPWRWDRWHPGPPFADPSAFAIGAGVVIACAVLALTYLRRGAVVWMWLPVAVYPLAPVFALTVARTGPETAEVIANTMRHVSELAVVIALCAALVLATGRTRGRAGGDEQRPADSRAIGQNQGGGPAWRIGAAVAAVLLIASSGVSTVSYAKSWGEQPSRDYFAGLRETAAERGPDDPLPDQAVALDVLLPVVAPNHMLSRLVDGVDGYPNVEKWSTDPVLLGDDGRPVDTEMLELRHIAQGPEEGCGTRITAGAGGAQIPLDGPLINREWVVQLNYFASADGTVELTLGGGEPETVPVTAGLGQVTVEVVGDGEALGVAPSPDVGDMCVASGPIGGLMPK